MTTPVLGVVIPTWNEEKYLPALLGDISQLGGPTDVVVVDGGSADETVAVARRHGARVVAAQRGRSVQLNAGAAAALGDWLCFLHADVRVPAAARDALVHTVADPGAGAAVWRLAIDARGLWFRVIEFGALLRDRVGGLPYGDQGLLVRRTLFDGAGGFPEIPILEDVALLRAIRRRAAVRRLPAAVVVSARRWHREGPVRSWLRNIGLIGAFLAGVPPQRLARWYRAEPRSQ